MPFLGTTGGGSVKQFGGQANLGYFIKNSLRFRGANNAYLSRTPSVTGNRKVWTWSAWVKRGQLDSGATDRILFSSPSQSGNDGIAAIYFNGDQLHTYYDTSGANPYGAIGPAYYRDPSAWYHIVWAVDAVNTIHKVYVNNVLVSTDTSKYPPNYDYSMNRAGYTHTFGTQAWGPTNYFDGYMAEVNFVDGQFLDPSYFGYTDAITGIWQPKRYTGAYGINGFYLSFNVDTTFSTDFLVVAGGAGGGSNRGGGGGAGGFRTSAGTSGANSAAETALTLSTGVAYTVTVGAGGGSYTNGSNSVFSTVTSLGGGRGGGASNGEPASGGSGGGGAGDDGAGFAGTAGQGFAGGTGEDNGGSGRSGGGGGGAGQVGATAVNGTFTAGNGGNGLASTISGSSVTYAAGGGGGHLNNGTAGTAGTGGSGGLGGNGASGSSGGTGGSASANTGSGGGGSAAVASGGSGGSGIVVIKIPSSRTAFFSSGVTFTGGTASGGFRIYTVTQTSTTSETVTFA